MASKDIEKAQADIAALDADGSGNLTKKELDQQVKAGNEAAKKVQDRLNAMFKKYDKDGDGSISKSELRSVLMAISNGNKGKDGKNSVSEMDIEYAFMHADRNNDGRIDVGEFVAWVTGADKDGKEGGAKQKVMAEMGEKEKVLKGPERFFYDKSSYTGAHTTGGPSTRETEADRHQRLAKESSVSEQADEVPWGGVETKFTAFAGKDMDGGEFAKLCRDCKLFDKNFKNPDADMIFAKVVEKGKRRIGMEQFKTALRHVAAKKQCKVSQVQGAVAGGEKVSTGTVAEANKFYDDKKLWTGCAVNGGPDAWSETR